MAQDERLKLKLLTNILERIKAEYNIRYSIKRPQDRYGYDVILQKCDYRQATHIDHFLLDDGPDYAEKMFERSAEQVCREVGKKMVNANAGDIKFYVSNDDISSGNAVYADNTCTITTTDTWGSGTVAYPEWTTNPQLYIQGGMNYGGYDIEVDDDGVLVAKGKTKKKKSRARKKFDRFIDELRASVDLRLETALAGVV